jgi:hypothetical protein
MVLDPLRRKLACLMEKHEPDKEVKLRLSDGPLTTALKMQLRHTGTGKTIQPKAYLTSHRAWPNIVDDPNSLIIPQHHLFHQSLSL